MAPAGPLPGEVREPFSGGAPRPLSGGASTSIGGRASPETARPSPALVPATARRGAAMPDSRIHRPNVVTRRAAAELTGAVTRYRGVRHNKTTTTTTTSTTTTTRLWRNVSSQVRRTSCDNYVSMPTRTRRTTTPPTTTRLWRNVSS